MPQPYLSFEAEWHDAFWAAEDDESELPLLADFLDDHPGTALEIGSGSGRLMLPLIQQGHQVDGLELSPDMRTLAADKAAAMGIHATVHEGDMCQWLPERPYAAILAPAFTLQLATDPRAALRHWHQMLTPDAGLYLTTFMPYAEILGDLPEQEWYPDHQAKLADGRTGTLTTRHQLDHKHQLLLREHRYSIEGDDSIMHQCTQQIRWIEHSQMLNHLNDAGFELMRYFLDFDPKYVLAEPSHHDFDGIITYLARKQGS